MDRGLATSARRIEQADSLESVWAEFLSTLSSMGITRAIYITVASGSNSDPLLMTNMPPKWKENVSGSARTFDPFLEYCCSTYEITLTGVAFLDDYPYLDDKARWFIKKSAESGFVSGLGIPMRLMGSPRYGGFNIGTGYERVQFELEILPLVEQLRAFCLLAHRRIEELAPAGSTFQAMQALSNREKQCLTLLAGGLKVARVAYELEISESAVRLYIRNARAKLGARTREEAIARALGQGLVA